MGSLTLDHWIKIAQILAAIFFGGAALVVSWQQLKIAKAKQKLELYDRRLVILRKIQDFVSLMINVSSLSTQDIANFRKEISEAQFLFGSDVNILLKRLVDDAFEIDMMGIYLEELRTGNPVPYAPKNPARVRGELKKGLLKNLELMLNETTRYMNLAS